MATKKSGSSKRTTDETPDLATAVQEAIDAFGSIKDKTPEELTTDVVEPVRQKVQSALDAVISANAVLMQKSSLTQQMRSNLQYISDECETLARTLTEYTSIEDY